jgi:hypothetical protein
MKLELHLVPKTSYYENLRNKLGRDWSVLSKSIRDSKQFTCELCGWKQVPGKYTHLHELWEYDEETKTQKLVGFECVCPDCHAVHHWMHSELSGCNMDFLMRHACRINCCTESEFRQHIEDALSVWRKRSEIIWTIDTSYYASLKY